MIVVGYQGVGKTTYCQTDKQAIDLESSLFNKADPLWYEDYVRVAMSLTANHIVFVSAHKVVRDELRKQGAEWVIIMPSLNIKDVWIARLQARYTASGSDKDMRALMHAKAHFIDSVTELYDEDVPKFCLNEHQYVSDALLLIMCWKGAKG